MKEILADHMLCADENPTESWILSKILALPKEKKLILDKLIFLNSKPGLKESMFIVVRVKIIKRPAGYSLHSK